MKPTKLDDVPGESKADKLAQLMAEHKTLHIQEKFNGIGFRAQRSQGELHVRTTRGNLWRPRFFGHKMTEALFWFLANLDRDATLYGEFIAVDPLVHLATLSGALNCKSEFCNHAVPTRAVVYDFDPGYSQTFLGRAARLVSLYRPTNEIICPRTYTTQLVEDVITTYHEIVDAGGEGIIIRADPCYFCAGVSPMMWKWKRLHDMEGICVAVKEGEGKRKGMLGAMLVRFPSCDEPVWVGGGAGLTDDVLRLLWTNPPIDQQMTVTYEETSINGTPLRPQLVCPRNYE